MGKEVESLEQSRWMAIDTLALKIANFIKEFYDIELDYTDKRFIRLILLESWIMGQTHECISKIKEEAK